MRARMKKQVVEVTIEFEFDGERPLDKQRLDWIARQLQQHADGDMRKTLRVLKFLGEE